MSCSLRVLEPEELQLVAGGSMDPSQIPEWWYYDVIVVSYTAPSSPWVTSMTYAEYMQNYYQDPNAQVFDPAESSGGTGSSSNYPSGFDHALDNMVDAYAAAIGAQIAAKPNAGQNEYAALLWKDANGNVHATTIKEGTGNSVDLDSLWEEVDFANGGTVVGVIHSHPHNNTGLNGDTISSGDFDRLMEGYQSAPGSGYDNQNLRDYLVFNGAVTEYYGFAQNPAYIGVGGQATFAVASTDYGN